ncbi:MAG: hypothetical protein Q9166_005402 [cf. Caloplaca sp. 2 TL-2023]
MCKFKDKCKQLFHRKKHASKDEVAGEERAQPSQPKRNGNMLRKARPSVSRFPIDSADFIVGLKPTELSAGEISPSEGPGPLQAAQEYIEQANPPSDVRVNTEAQPSTSENTSAKDFINQQVSGAEDIHIPVETGPVQPSLPTLEALPSEGTITHPGLEENHKDQPTTWSFAKSTEEFQTPSKDSPARYTSSCPSTPSPDSRFRQTPGSSRSSESTWHIQMIHGPFRSSSAVRPASGSIDPRAPNTNATDAFSIFERCIGSGPERSGALMSLAHILNEEALPERQKPYNSAKATRKSDALEYISHSAAEDDGNTGNRASIKSQTSSAWEHAMESRERSFQIELDELRDDHVAEVSDLKEKITNLEKEAEAARRRKSYTESVASQKLADKDAELKQKDSELRAKDDEICFQTSLFEAAYSAKEEKDIELEDSKAKIGELEEQLAYWLPLYTEICNDRIANQRYVIEPLRQEVARLTAINRDYEHQLSDQFSRISFLENSESQVHQAVAPLQQEVARLRAQNFDNERTISNQSSQIAFLRDIHAQMEQSQLELTHTLVQTYQERDEYKSDLERFRNLHEQALRDLIAAQDEINAKNQRLQEYNYDHEDDPQAVETADLLKKSKKAYQALEMRANECLAREQQACKKHENEKTIWKLKMEKVQQENDDLEGKFALLEMSNGRMAKEIEGRIDEEYDEADGTQPRDSDPLRFLYDELKQTVSELREHISQQDAQIKIGAKDIQNHKITIATRNYMLQDKDSEIHILREAKADAEHQVDETQRESDEREIFSNEELAKAVSDIDWYKDQVEQYKSEIHAMTINGVPTTVVANHQHEVQTLQQHIADLEAENYHFHRQRHDQKRKDMHDGMCAANGELASKVMQMNYHNALQEIEKLRRDMELLNQGCDPQKFEITEELADLREKHEELQLKQKAGEERAADVKEDLFMTVKLAMMLRRWLKTIWADQPVRVEALEQVDVAFKGMVDKYNDNDEEDAEDGGVWVEENAGREEDDYERTQEDEVVGDDGLEAVTDPEPNTASPAEGTPFTIPPSTLQDSWTSFLTNLYPSASGHQVPGRNPSLAEDQPSTTSYHPTRTFAVPSPSSPDTSSYPSLPPYSSSSDGYDDNNEPDRSTSSRAQIPYTPDREYYIKRDADGYKLGPLILYTPFEDVEAELLTPGAFYVIFPQYAPSRYHEFFADPFFCLV